MQLKILSIYRQLLWGKMNEWIAEREHISSSVYKLILLKMSINTFDFLYLPRGAFIKFKGRRCEKKRKRKRAQQQNKSPASKN